MEAARRQWLVWLFHSPQSWTCLMCTSRREQIKHFSGRRSRDGADMAQNPNEPDADTSKAWKPAITADHTQTPSDGHRPTIKRIALA